MLAEERRDKLLHMINENSSISTSEISKVLGVSPVTVRTDLNFLEKIGKIQRVHGGAVAIQTRLNQEIPSSQKSKLNRQAKQIIGRTAAEMVKDGDVIILDSGTTTFQIGLALKGRKITVITNDIEIGRLMAEEEDCTLIMTGGVAMKTVPTLTGIDAVNFFSSIQADKLFLGCDAIDWSFGVSNRTLDEVSVKKAMIRASDEIIAVADRSKLDQRVFARVCHFDELDLFLTDRLTDREKEECERIGLCYRTVIE